MKNKRDPDHRRAGLIGSHIADLVAQEGSRAKSSSSTISCAAAARTCATPPPRFRLTIVEGDIRDRDLLAKAVSTASTSSSIRPRSASPSAPKSRAWPSTCWPTGTFNVLEAAVKAGVSKVVAASSASVLGLAERFPTNESHHPYNNRTIYGAAKTFNEGLLRSFNEMYGLNYVALRYFNVYGPRMDVHGAYTEVLIRWMERIAAGQPPMIFGDGTQTMDFVHVHDIARANILAAKSHVTDEVFNVASGTETSLLELADDADRASWARRSSRSMPPARKVNGVTRRLADTSKAQRDARLRGRDPPRGRACAIWSTGGVTSAAERAEAAE